MVYNVFSFVFIVNVIKTSAFNMTVSDKMVEANLISDVVPIPPAEYLKITYPSGVEVSLGNILTPRQTKDEPLVEWSPEPDTFYTLCMINADHRKNFNPLYRQWVHWIVGNIPGNDTKKGDTICEYVGPFPRKGKAPFRYVFMMYSQFERKNFSEPHLKNKTLSDRAGFVLNEFVKKYFLGIPLFGNFFKSQWDDYASELSSSLAKASVPIKDDDE